MAKRIQTIGVPMARVADRALQRLHHVRKLHVSLDMDSLDPSEAPGVGTPYRAALPTAKHTCSWKSWVTAVGSARWTWWSLILF